jgi:hypothetical protein
MAADDIKLPTAITNKSDSDVGDYEDINDDRLSHTNSSSKCAPVHFEPRHNITHNTTNNIKCFTEQQSAASTSASVKQSFTANEFLTKATQQNEQISSSADVSEHSRISEHGSKLSNSSTKPSLSESCLPGETYEYLDIDDGYDDIDKAANAVRCSHTSRRSSDLIRAASSLDDDEDYEVIDAIGSGNTNNEQNTSLQLNSKNVLYSSSPAPDNTNHTTAHASSSSLQTATSSLNASSMADQSESSAPDTDKTRFIKFLALNITLTKFAILVS